MPPIVEECCPNYWDSHSIMKKKKKTQKLTDVECLVCTVPMTERYNYIYIYSATSCGMLLKLLGFPQYEEEEDD